MINMRKIHPWYITGLIDAEGSFAVNILKDDSRKSGYIITHSLELALNVKDKILLDKIKSTLKVGNIYYRSRDNTYIWKVSNINELVDVILPHLDNHRLLTRKISDFWIFKSIIDIMHNKGHYNSKGIDKILHLRTLLNERKLKIRGKFVAEVSSISLLLLSNPLWLTGFVEGEGCFYISIYKSSKSKLGFAVQLIFKITQHSRDIAVLSSIRRSFECGRIEKRGNKSICDFTVSSFKEITSKIIPHFSKYPLMGAKSLDFDDFKKAVYIISSKDHLTARGLEKLIQIKSNMNTRRKF